MEGIESSDFYRISAEREAGTPMPEDEDFAQMQRESLGKAHAGAG